MITTLLSLLTASLLGLASFATNQTLDGVDVLAIAFATALVAWTISQYRTPARPLTLARPIHLPVTPGVRHSVRQVGRLAA